MDVVYEILDGLHVFIPVIAIVACVIIFVCGMRSSKSAQPPDEYLQEIKANAAKSKTRNKSSKSQSSSTSSPRTENNLTEKIVKPSSSTENKREKPKVVEEKQKIETKKTKKSTKNSSAEASPEKKSTGLGSHEAVESTQWVTVTPKRKQKDGGVSVTKSPVKNTVSDSTPEDEVKKFTTEDFPKLDEKTEKVQPLADKTINEVDTKLSRQEPATENHQSLDAAIDDDDVWSVQTAKDSRYRKAAKKQKGSKNDILIEENFTSPQIESFSNSDADQTKTNEARKRRNVRRDN